MADKLFVAIARQIRNRMAPHESLRTCGRVAVLREMAGLEANTGTAGWREGTQEGRMVSG
jgi:hypothetical protein